MYLFNILKYKFFNLSDSYFFIVFVISKTNKNPKKLENKFSILFSNLIAYFFENIDNKIQNSGYILFQNEYQNLLNCYSLNNLFFS